VSARRMKSDTDCCGNARHPAREGRCGRGSASESAWFGPQRSEAGEIDRTGRQPALFSRDVNTEGDSEGNEEPSGPRRGPRHTRGNREQGRVARDPARCPRDQGWPRSPTPRCARPGTVASPRLCLSPRSAPADPAPRGMPPRRSSARSPQSRVLLCAGSVALLKSEKQLRKHQVRTLHPEFLPSGARSACWTAVRHRSDTSSAR
jgi:hypothetical protein